MVPQTKILGNDMKSIFRIIAAVSSLLTVLSCAKEIDQPIDQPSEPETYTLSISASKGEFTKALELDGNTLNAIWGDDDEVYVFLNDNLTNFIAKLRPDQHAHSNPAECILEGPFTTVPVAGDVLTLKITSNNYSEQDGTLSFIAGHCDYAVATLHVTGVNNGQIESTEGSAAFVNQQAIVKFTLKDKADGTTLLTPSTLTVNDGTSDIATVTPANPAATYSTNGSNGVLYVAIPPIAGKTLTLTATVGEDTYSYTRFPVTFAQGQYYTISVKMIKQRLVNLSALDPGTFPTDANSTPYYTVSDGDILTGTFPGNCDLCIPDGATVTLNGMTHHAGKWIYGIKCLGSASIILAPGTVNDLTCGDNRAYAGIGMNGDDDCTLTIEGGGTLNVSGGEYSPGIGGWGNIVINGGDITATGGYYCAGIGAGYNNSCGSITINGGKVNARGGQDATGIGCGWDYSLCGDITFNGGTVTVTNGDSGRGVGAIPSMSNTACGNIYFSGGTVTVWGGISISGRSFIYVDGVNKGFSIDESPYYYPAQ